MSRKPKTERPAAPAAPLVAQPLNPHDPKVASDVARMKAAMGQ